MRSVAGFRRTISTAQSGPRITPQSAPEIRHLCDRPRRRPPPTVRIPTPLWGSEQHVREPFTTWDVELEFERAVMAFTLGSVEDWLQFYETNYGPTIRAKSILERADRWGDCRAELADLFQSQNRSTDGTDVRIEAEYMLIVARPQARRADRQDVPGSRPAPGGGG